MIKRDYPCSGILGILTTCQLERFTFHFSHLTENQCKYKKTLIKSPEQ